MANNTLITNFLYGLGTGIALYGVGMILHGLHISHSFATSSGHHGGGHHGGNKGAKHHHHKHMSHTRLDESDVLRASGQDPSDSFPKLSTN
jgi:hypothetical protein